MNKQKLYETVIQSISKTIKKYLFEDTLELDIDLTQISISELKEKYNDYRLITVEPGYGDPLYSDKRHNLNESFSKYSEDINVVKKSICKKYGLSDWQFCILNSCNDIKIAIICPEIGENAELIDKDMTQLGYYESIRTAKTVHNLNYIVMQYEPRYPKELTDEIYHMKYIFHLAPKYCLESIKENGFIPQHKNTKFKYPNRVYFFKSNINLPDLMDIGQQLSDSNKDIKNDGSYILFIIDATKLPKNIHFIGDSTCDYGICTEDIVPYDVVIFYKDVDFIK